MTENGNAALAAELLEVQRTLGWMDLVIGNITDAVYVVDEESNLVFANQYFSDIVAIPRVFLLGRNLGEVFSAKPIHDPNREFVSEADALDADTGGQTGLYEWELGERHCIFKISCRYIATIKQTVYIAKNITTEYELSVMKSNFINIASHQLRTPMTAIMTYAHMLHDGYAGKMDAGQQDIVGKIVGSSERMISLINDILLISRVQNGEENLMDKNSTLAEVLETIETDLRPRAQAKQLQFVTKYPADIQQVRCNQFLIHEVLSNLLSNAIQYTPEAGTVAMAVAINKKKVKISVRDSGIGIPSDYISDMYKQFSRAPNAFAVFNQGTGLGLYIVKIILDQIGGTITCTSEVNKGTTFNIVFPV